MTRRQVFPFVGVALAIVGAVGTAVIQLVFPAPFLGGFGFNPATMLGFVIQGLTWAGIGALLVVRRPGNAIGWLMVAVGVGYALSQLTVSITFSFANEGTARGDDMAQVAGWLTVLLQLVTILHFAIGFVYPTGRVQSRGWARFMWFFWVFAVVFVVTSLIQPGPLQLMPALENPFGFGPDLRGNRPIAPILALATLIIFVSLVISMITRYRSAGQVERQQQKWFVLAQSVSAIGLGIVTGETIFDDRPENAIGLTVYVFAGTLVPMAIAIAILRHHLYDIDRIISRTIAYAVMTATLGATFAGAALILGTVLGSQGPGETLQVAGATLIVVALFGPVRRRAQVIVDRRFDRSHYDAARTIGDLTARLRDDVDLDRLETDVLNVLDDTFHPADATVWLRPRATSPTPSPVTIPGHRRSTMTTT